MSLKLNFRTLPDRSQIPRQRKLIQKPIRRVIVWFEDGSKSTWDIPNAGQGFYRERYIFQERGDGAQVNQLLVHELHWSYVQQPPKVEEKPEL